MGRRLGWKFFLIALVVGISIFAIYPPDKKINLGLDLQGGIHLILQADRKSIPKDTNVGDAVNRTLEKIRNRIDEFGVAEPSIQRQGEDRIIIQLPGIKDPDKAKSVIGRTALLEFKLVMKDDVKLDLVNKKADEVSMDLYKKPLKEILTDLKNENKIENLKQINARLGSMLPKRYELGFSHEKDREGKYEYKTMLVQKEASITGARLVRAEVGFTDNVNQHIVNLEFDGPGAKKFAKVTRDNVETPLAIVLDGRIKSFPNIREEIPNGKAQIEGSFTMEEAKELAIILTVGALEAPVHIIEERKVGPTLGRDSIRNGLRASMVGTVLVVLFMILYYRVSGLIANIALAMNLLILFGALAAMNATLTLPGIAGIVLTIGMAVDANVIIFERIKEELRNGKTIRSAIDAGFKRAFWTIFDANVTTILTAAILYWKGVGPIRGFGTTLIIGLLANMFTAIFVCKVIFDWMTLNFNVKKLSI